MAKNDWDIELIPPMVGLSSKRLQLEEQRDALIAYLSSKIKARDWHAVQDAASDIREVEAKLEMIDG